MKKHFYSVIRVTCIMVILVLAFFNAKAQKNTIQLKDAVSHKSIADVYFEYNGKSGFSDDKGEIELEDGENKYLFLSHLQYGKIQISSSDLKTGIKLGVIELESRSTHLLPVTFVQVHQGAGDKGKMDFSTQNKLSHDAGNLLESVPSISTIRKSGAYGFDPVVRGFKYDQLNIVIDGVQSASAACPNRMDPAASQIPINMISQAEILKGPHSLRYGNAFGATINFKSGAPQFKERTTPEGRWGTSYESNGKIFRTEAVAGVSGKKIDFNIFGSYSTGDDYTDGDGVDVAARFNRLNWGGKVGFKLAQNQTIGLLVSNNYAKDVDFPALPMDLREDDTWLLNASHSAQFYGKNLSTWSTTVYRTKVNHLMDNYDKVLDPRKVDAVTEARTRNYGGRTELRFDFRDNYLYTGLDYRMESADGFRTREMLMGPMQGKVFEDNVWQDAEIRRAGMFGEFHVNRPGLLLVFSGRLDYNKAKANNLHERFSITYSDWNTKDVHASFSLGGTKELSKQSTVGVWFGRASRGAGIAERYINQFPIGLDPYEMLGNPLLDPEINNQFDLVFQHQNKTTQLSFNWFLSFLHDYISSEIRTDLTPAMATSPGVRQFINIDKAFMTGVEFNWKQKLSKLIQQNMSLVYTHGENKELNEPLPEIPPLEFKYALNGTFYGGRLLPELMFRQVFKQDRIAKSYGENESPAFNVVDAKLSWLINKTWTATGGVQNLFDKAYYEHLARSVRGVEARPIYSPGRNFYVTLTIELR